jgi:exosome complex RNA-binding protein Rrp42 (RNase PH superfamily)
MSPLAFPALEVGRPSAESVALGEHLSHLLVHTPMLDLNQLMITPGARALFLLSSLSFLLLVHLCVSV